MLVKMHGVTQKEHCWSVTVFCSILYTTVLLLLNKLPHRWLSRVAPVVKSLEGQVLPSGVGRY